MVDAALVAKAHGVDELKEDVPDEDVVVAEDAVVDGVEEMAAGGEFEDDEQTSVVGEAAVEGRDVEVGAAMEVQLDLALVVARPLIRIGHNGSKTLDSVVGRHVGGRGGVEGLVDGAVGSGAEDFCKVVTPLIEETVSEVGDGGGHDSDR